MTTALADASLAESDRAIVAALMDIAADEALIGHAEGLVRQGMDAVSAVIGATEATAAEFGAVEDSYLRARTDDINAVGRQISLALLGEEEADLSGIPEGAILVADDIGAWDLARAPLEAYRRHRLRQGRRDLAYRHHRALARHSRGARPRRPHPRACRGQGDRDRRVQRLGHGGSRRDDPLGNRAADQRCREGTRDPCRFQGHDSKARRRNRDRSRGQSRLAGRDRAGEGSRSHGRRPVPHRASLHAAHASAVGGFAGRDLRHAGQGVRALSRDHPHAGHRRRQAGRRHRVSRGGKPLPRMARHPHVPRPSGYLQDTAAGAAARRRSRQRQGHAADGLGPLRGRADQRCWSRNAPPS